MKTRGSQGPAHIVRIGGCQAAGCSRVEQQPFDGSTFADSFSSAAAPERHTQQYCEILGNRGMYKDGWLYTQRLRRIPWSLDPEALRAFGPGWDPDVRPFSVRRSSRPSQHLEAHIARSG